MRPYRAVPFQGDAEVPAPGAGLKAALLEAWQRLPRRCSVSLGLG
jgi:hypothetical protein